MQYRADLTSSRLEMMPSACSSPCTNSMSAPGVRIVVVKGSPPILISSGSSPATVSGRLLKAPSR